MICVCIEGIEEEMFEFMEKMLDIFGFEKIYLRELRKGNNLKYDLSKNVFVYLFYKKIEVVNK